MRFLLDTTSGFINTEQNDIIKRFNVVSTMVAPPMLVTGFYGMNVDGLPYLHSKFGFTIVAIVMVISFVVPMVYFRRRGWL